MLAALLVVLLSLALCHWLLRPMVLLLTPLLDLSWLGWAALPLLLWFLAGGEAAGEDHRGPHH